MHVTILLTSLLIAVCNGLDRGLQNAFGKLPSSECKFRCENGAKPRRNASYKPITGRCGHASAKLAEGLHVLPEVQLCCDKRDRCFQTCGNSFSHCEEAFRKCINDNVIGAGIGLLLKRQELVKPPTCATFLAAQKSACSCEAIVGGTTEESSETSKDKPKMKVVERGTEDHKMLYIMPEEEDEEEYIRKNPMPVHEKRDEL